MQPVIVNGEARDVPEGSTVSTLLEALGLDSAEVAVERNREIVPRAAYAETALEGGDQLEIVTFVGGG